MALTSAKFQTISPQYLAYGSISASYQTLTGDLKDVKKLFLFNTCNQALQITLNGADAQVVDWCRLPASNSITIDFDESSLFYGNIKVKHLGTAPTSGEISVALIFADVD